MAIILFNESGTLPGGIPGTFAGVMVEVDDEGKIVEVNPLPRHPHFEPATLQVSAQPKDAEVPESVPEPVVSPEPIAEPEPISPPSEEGEQS